MIDSAPDRKWRPTLAMIITGVLLTVLMLPIGGLALIGLLTETAIRENWIPFALAASAVVIATLMIAFVLVRTMSRPIAELLARSREIGSGDRSAIKDLEHHGSREFADLSNSSLAMAESLFGRMDYLATFTSHVSHEFKTPLTSISGAVELLLDPANTMTADEQKRFLQNIRDDSQRLDLLVQRLRDLARAENVAVDGTCLITELVNATRPLFPTVKVEIANETDQNATAVRSLPISRDAGEMILTHLLENAQDHGAKTVALALHVDHDRLLWTISDDGEGVSVGNAERIFDVFFTTKREAGGTGMGLSIVQSAVRVRGGNIQLISSVDGGACFEIDLPMTDSEN